MDGVLDDSGQRVSNKYIQRWRVVVISELFTSILQLT